MSFDPFRVELSDGEIINMIGLAHYWPQMQEQKPLAKSEPQFYGAVKAAKERTGPEDARRIALLPADRMIPPKEWAELTGDNLPTLNSAIKRIKDRESQTGIKLIRQEMSKTGSKSMGEFGGSKVRLFGRVA